MRKIIWDLINTLMKTNCPVLPILSLCCRVSFFFYGSLYYLYYGTLPVNHYSSYLSYNSIVNSSPVPTIVQVYEEFSVSYLPNKWDNIDLQYIKQTKPWGIKICQKVSNNISNSGNNLDICPYTMDKHSLDHSSRKFLQQMEPLEKTTTNLNAKFWNPVLMATSTKQLLNIRLRVHCKRQGIWDCVS